MLQIFKILVAVLFCLTCKLKAVTITPPDFKRITALNTDQRAELPCFYNTSSGTNSTINWTRGTSNRTVVYEVTITNKKLPGRGYDGRVRLGENASLVLERPVPSDTSNYTCTIINSKDEVVEDVSVVSLLVAALPRIEKSSSDEIKFYKGDTISLSCQTSGIPTPTVSWSKDGQPLQANGTSFEVQEADPTDEGSYKCMSENIAGNDYRIFEVTYCDEVERKKTLAIVFLAIDFIVAGCFGIYIWKKRNVSFRKTRYRGDRPGEENFAVMKKTLAIVSAIISVLAGVSLLVFVVLGCRPDLYGLLYTGIVSSCLSLVVALVLTIIILSQKGSLCWKRHRGKRLEEEIQLLPTQLFVETSQYKMLEDSVMSVGKMGVVVVGYVGDGKSTAARYLASKLEEYKLIEATTIMEIKQEVDKGEKVVAVVDDPFGTWCMLTAKVDDWVVDLEKLQTLFTTGSLKLILTTRKRVWDECRYDLKHVPPFDCIVDFTSSPLSETERQEILKIHLPNKVINDEMVNRIAEQASPFGFPQCCKYFAAHKKFNEAGAEFFWDQFKYIRSILRSIKQKTPAIFNTLAVIMLNGGSIPRTEIKQPGQKLQQIVNEVSESLGGSKFSVSVFTEKLSNISKLKPYLKNTPDSITLSHDSLYEAVALVIAETEETLLFKYCTLEFLARTVVVDSCPNPDNAEYGKAWISIRKEYQEKLCEVLTQMILKHQARIAFQNPSWKYESFCKIWLDYVKQRLDEIIFGRCKVCHFSVLHWAALSGRSEIFRLLVHSIPESDRYSKLFNLQTNHGQTLLHTAAMGGDVDLVKFLISMGISPNVIDCDEAGWTPLYAASAFGKADVVKVLLDEGADANQKTKYGISPLLVAAHYKHDDVIKVIQKHSGDTESMSALENQVLEIAGRSAMHVLVRDGNTDPIKKLLDSGAVDVNEPNSVGWSPLYIATVFGNDELVSLLLRYNADANVRTPYGRTPHYIAIVYGLRNIEKMLEIHKAVHQ